MFDTNIEEVVELPESRNGIVDFELEFFCDRPVGQLAYGFVSGESTRTPVIKDIVTYQDELYIISLDTIYRVTKWN